MLTQKQRDVIERARKEGGRVIEIDRKEGRVYRETAGVNTLLKLAKQKQAWYSRVLLNEQERLVRTWNQKERKWK